MAKSKRKHPVRLIKERSVEHAQSSKRRRVLLALGWWDYEINRGVAQYAHEAQWLLNDLMGHKARVPTTFVWNGVITLLCYGQNDLLRTVLRPKTPVVDLSNALTRVKLPRVLHDNLAIGRMAAEHLLSRGLRHLAFYQAFDETVERERMAGFRAAAIKGGAEFHHINLSPRRQVKHGRGPMAALVKAVQRLPKPVGIMGQFDGTATEVVLACETAGLAIPDQVSVVGVDNDPISSELGPIPLTSVDSDRFRLGYEGARLLDQLMAGRSAPAKPIYVPPKTVIVRQSSDIVAIENPAVSRAAGFIRQHYHEPISVQDITRVAAVSRRTLYYLFEEHLGTSVRDELERVRIDHAKRMLRDTRDKVTTIARACGFTNGEHLSHTFSRATGMSPVQFRLQHHKKMRSQS